MSLQDEQFAFLKDVRRLLTKAEELSFEVSGGELERTIETQTMLVRTGAEASMDSTHLRRCAIALNLFRPDGDRWRLVQSPVELDELGRYWEELDPRNIWGGRQGGVLQLGCFERNPGGWPSKLVAQLDQPDVSLLAMEAVALADSDRPSAVVLSASTQDRSRPILKRSSTDPGGVGLLQELLVKAGKLDKAAARGSFDLATELAVKEFQRDKELVVDGVVGEKTWKTLELEASAIQGGVAPAVSRFLGEQDFVRAASDLNLEVAIIKAVYKVESNGKGFIGEKPKILFEGHVLWDRLKRKGKNPVQLAVGNESILYPKWTKEHYVGGAGEFKRLELAESIDQEAARESASWGLFQIMGYHWQSLGYPSVGNFIDCMSRHESEQLEAFCRFIKTKKIKDGHSLRDLLKVKDWAGFAFYYNGSEYRKNAYDDKLREHYRQFSAGS
ncbi:MAG TPA: N-acetylmuramidase family protein [Rhodocyclaceae bacterium]|nr:N-acetylmuramidase family protein [Rhodocyclaceae bacterium]